MLKSKTFSEMKRNFPKETHDLKTSLYTGGVILGVIQALLRQC